MGNVIQLDARVCMRVFTDFSPELDKSWGHLYAGLHTPSFLQHPEWYRCWDSAYGSRKDKENIFVLIEEAGVPIAIVPLAYYRSAHVGVAVRRLALQTDFELKDFIFDERKFTPRVFLDALQALARHERYAWDVFAADRLAQDSLACRLLSEARTASRHLEQSQVMNRLRRRSDGDAAFAIPKGWLKTLQKKQRRLADLGAVGFDIVSEEPVSEEPVAKEPALVAAYASFLQIEGAGWKGEAGNNTSLLQDAHQQKFYCDLVATVADGFAGSVALLTLNNVAVAATVNLRVGDTFNIMKIAYDENYRDFSPGNLLILKIAENLSGDTGIAYVNFISGLEWHKIWGPETLPVFDMNFYSRTPCGYALLLKARLKPLVQQFSKVLKALTV